jgi:flagellar biosynthesis protein FlhB
VADDEDQESKTEEPTEKRLSEAVEKGNVPFAREAALFGSLAATFTACLLFGGWPVAQLLPLLSALLDRSGSIRLDDREGVANLLAIVVTDGATAILPALAMISAGTVIASLVQNVPSAASDRIVPKLNRISPVAGWNRLFGKAAWVEFAKSCVKLLMTVTVVFFVIRSEFAGFAAALYTEPALFPPWLMAKTVNALIAFTILALVLAIGDLAWSRIKWRRGLRMTRHEVTEEMKQAEGDPHIKARIRNIARQRTSRRMLEKLPTATMVIANPTHFAVALRYVREEGGAPVVVAKGIDFMALKIRERAAEHEVPVVENKPLARALYDQVEIDQQIPPEFYRAIAEIIHYLHGRRQLPVPPRRS